MRNIIAACLAAVILTGASARVSTANAPQTVPEPIFTLVWPDIDNGVAAFWNITRDAFCSWAAGGFAGPPPVIEPVPVEYVEVHSGAILSRWHATRPIELWRLDEGAPVDPCLDTDGTFEPWATGSGTGTWNDNDVFASGTRGNAFGGLGSAIVTDDSGGEWSYKVAFRAMIMLDGEVRQVVEWTRLAPR
jgi:hypothetical protein